MYRCLCVCLVLLLVGHSSAWANSDDTQGSTSKPKQKDQMPKPVVELSFGHSQLFNESKYAAVRQVGVGGIVPTSSVLFIGEWLTAPRWGVLAVFNLPLTTQQTVNEQGEVFQERVAPSVALGGRYSLLHFDLRPRAMVEVQLTALAGRTIKSLEGDFFFPLAGGRIHIARPSGFAMYMGATWAFQKDTLALFYGAAHRF